MAEKLTFHFDVKVYKEAGSSSYQAESIEPIGAGAYAKVWAVRSADGRLFRAVKVTSPEDQAKLVDEFLCLEKLKRLDDDGLIMRAYAIGKTSDDRPCMLMELITGQQLWKLGQEIRGVLPDTPDARWMEYELFRVRVATQITKVLYTAYKARIVLTDLKMDNFYYDPSWPQLIKVVDWNLVYTNDIPSELGRVFVNETLPKIGKMIYEIFTGLNIDSPDQIGEVRSDQTWAMLWDVLTFQTRSLIRDIWFGQVTQNNPALELWSNWTAHRRLLIEREGLDELRGLERGHLERHPDTELRSGMLLQAYSILNLIEPNMSRAAGLREAWHGWIGSLVLQRDFSLALLELRTARRLYSNSLRLDFWYLFSLLGQYAPTRSTYLENIQNQAALPENFWKDGKFEELSNLLSLVRKRAEQFWYPSLKNLDVNIWLQQRFEHLEKILNIYNLLLKQEKEILEKPAAAKAISNQVSDLLQSLPWLDTYLDDVVPYKPTPRDLWNRQPLYHDIYVYSLGTNNSVSELTQKYEDLAKLPHLYPKLSGKLENVLEILRAFDSISYYEVNPIISNLEKSAENHHKKVPGLVTIIEQDKRKLLDLQRVYEDIQNQSKLLKDRLDEQLGKLGQLDNKANNQKQKLIDSITELRSKLAQVERVQLKLEGRSNSRQIFNKDLQDNLDRLKKNITNRKGILTKIGSEIRDLWQRIEDLIREMDLIEQEQKSLYKAINALEEGFENLDNRYITLSKHAENLKAGFAVLNINLIDIQKLDQELVKQYTDLDGHRQTIEELHKELEKSFEEAKVALPVFNKLAREIDQGIDELSERRELMDGKLNNLGKDFQEIDKKQVVVSDSADHLRELVSKLDQMKLTLQQQLTATEVAFDKIKKAVKTYQKQSIEIQEILDKYLEDARVFEGTIAKLNKQFNTLDDATSHLQGRSTSINEQLEIVAAHQGEMIHTAERLQKEQTELIEKVGNLEVQRRSLVRRQKRENLLLMLAGRDTRRLKAVFNNGQTEPEFDALLTDIASKIPPDKNVDHRLTQIEQKVRVQQRYILGVAIIVCLFLFLVISVGILGVVQGLPGIMMAAPVGTATVTAITLPSVELTPALALQPPSQSPPETLTLSAPTIQTLSPVATLTPIATVWATTLRKIPLTLNAVDYNSSGSVAFVKTENGSNVIILPTSQVVAIGVYNHNNSNYVLIKTSDGNIGWVMGKYIDGWQESNLHPAVACYAYNSIAGYSQLPTPGTQSASDISGHERVSYQALAINKSDDSVYIQLRFKDNRTGWVLESALEECVGDLSTLPVENN